MPTYLICPIHRVQYVRGSRCPQCAPDRSTGAARTAQQKFRQQVLAASDGQCAYSDSAGVRCPITTTGLQAAHVTPYADDANYTVGVALCPQHHRTLDRR